VIDDGSTDRQAEEYQTVLTTLLSLEAAIGRQRDALKAGSHPTLEEFDGTLEGFAADVAAARHALEAFQKFRHAEHRRLIHDLRGPLNAIAAWAYILRLENNPTDNITQAADVLERNVRALTEVIESAG